MGDHRIDLQLAQASNEFTLQLPCAALAAHGLDKIGQFVLPGEAVRARLLPGLA